MADRPRPLPYRPDGPPRDAPAPARPAPAAPSRWRARADYARTQHRNRVDARPSPPPKSARPAWRSTSSWLGAFLMMVGVAAILWIVQIVSSMHSLVTFGLRPRTLVGLRGIVTEPFLHAGWEHLFSNTVPFILVGWVLLLAGWRTWLSVTVLVVVIGGLLTWLVAPGGAVIVGASATVFGWMGYLLGRAVFSREFKWIITAVVVLFFFGTLLFGLFPTLHSHVSWEAHVCGFVAGVVTAALLHRRRREPRRVGKRSALTPP